VSVENPIFKIQITNKWQYTTPEFSNGWIFSLIRVFCKKLWWQQGCIRMGL